MTHHPLLGRTLIGIALVLSSIVAGSAQSGRPRAEVTPVNHSTAVPAGSTVRVSLDVSLPKDVHVQSDKPRDPSLIATSLVITPPAGITVAGIDYPVATELAQEGQREPLAVFGPTFTVVARLTLATDLAAGTVTVPLRLRYQACDARSCFPPARADAEWKVEIK